MKKCDDLILKVRGFFYIWLMDFAICKTALRLFGQWIIHHMFTHVGCTKNDSIK